MHKFADDLSNADSLAVPAFNTNNFNWVTGHILVSRDLVIDLLNGAKLLSPENEALYETGSDRVTLESAVPLQQLLAVLDDSQEKIIQGLQLVADDELTALYDEERGQTVLDRIEGLHWHETYHLGQLEILRQVSAERESFP